MSAKLLRHGESRTMTLELDSWTLTIWFGPILGWDSFWFYEIQSVTPLDLRAPLWLNDGRRNH